VNPPFFKVGQGVFLFNILKILIDTPLKKGEIVRLRKGIREFFVAGSLHSE
jgi:hypothetical protein